VVAEENSVSKLKNTRGILALALAASFISGCATGGGISGTTKPVTTPPGAHSVGLTWDPSPSTNLKGYNVYRGQVSGGPYSPIASTIAVGTQQYTDSTVAAGQSYFYVVTSIDVNGMESGPSPEASAKIPAP
jgi:fibronectin type 3 domain-containing protein